MPTTRKRPKLTPRLQKDLQVFYPQTIGCERIYIYIFINIDFRVPRASGTGINLKGQYRREEQNNSLMTFMKENHVIPLVTAHDLK